MLVTVARSSEEVFTRTSGKMGEGAGDEKITGISLTIGDVDRLPAIVGKSTTELGGGGPDGVVGDGEVDMVNWREELKGTMCAQIHQLCKSVIGAGGGCGEVDREFSRYRSKNFG